MFSKQLFYLQPKIKPSRVEQSSKRHFWNVLNVVSESFCFAQETKAVFLSIRYPKTSQTQDVKSESTKRSLRKLAHPKRDSAFEQKTRIVSSKGIWRSSQNCFFSYNQRKKQSSAQKDIFGTYSTSFWKILCFAFGEVAQYFSEELCVNHENNCTQYKTTKTTFPKKIKSCFFKYSVSQDISKAFCCSFFCFFQSSCWRSVRAPENCNITFTL